MLSMKRVTLAIALSIAFSVCSLGINLFYLYYVHLRGVFGYGIVISSLSTALTVFCMIFSRKQNKEDKYYKVLMMASMLATVASMAIPVIATMIILFV